MSPSRGTLLVVSGPSGVGKTTIAERLKKAGLPKVMTTTTRAPRAGEVNGREYRFLSRAEFESAIARGEFLEYAEIVGNLYGTPKAEIETQLAAGKLVMVDIDTQGARSVRKLGLPAVFVFVAPPDMAELRKRLEGRKTETPEIVARRLAKAEQEMAEKDSYDRVVVNDTVDRAVEEILGVLRSRKLIG
jgi:guanylate kinase